MGLLNARAGCALAIGRLKEALGLEVYQPDRERQVIEHVRQVNEGPLDGEAVARLVLPSPCAVFVEGVDDSGAPPPGVSANGCEIAPKGTSRLQATRSAVRAGTTYVEAKVSGEAQLAVSAAQ